MGKIEKENCIVEYDDNIYDVKVEKVFVSYFVDDTNNKISVYFKNDEHKLFELCCCERLIQTSDNSFFAEHVYGGKKTYTYISGATTKEGFKYYKEKNWPVGPTNWDNISFGKNIFAFYNDSFSDKTVDILNANSGEIFNIADAKVRNTKFENENGYPIVLINRKYTEDELIYGLDTENGRINTPIYSVLQDRLIDLVEDEVIDYACPNLDEKTKYEKSEEITFANEIDSYIRAYRESEWKKKEKNIKKIEKRLSK